ncbi:isochorismatase family protein [Halomonas salifodinae]|uniref:Isochorismatase family protein n=1 Tax=Halomonas salifodinae TaxID=438745 RepID=A0ABW2EUE4_9GAMM
MRLEHEESLFLIIDLQSRLLPVVHGGEQAVAEAGWLGEVAQELQVPVWVTEQYPEGLGGTDPRLVERLPKARYFQKVHFGAHDEASVAEALRESGRHQVVICGSEAHICVMQSALGLLDAGYEVYWLVEATASRRPEEARLARERVTAMGAIPVSADMVAYEWLQRCDDERFKAVHRGYLRERADRSLRFF